MSTATIIVPPLNEIGPYRLEKKLGKGGMGEVYRAYDRRLERRVALKQIRPRKASDPRARQRFLREARAAARLSHPAIVQVHDILEAEGGDWLVMELVEGHTLRRVLSDGPMSTMEAIGLTIEIAGGLAEAHAEGIVHRDLKAENILVTTDGRAKILDFGIAKRLDLESEASLTAEGQLLGTPQAMSPEQAMGRSIDHRSDLFSLGSLVYEMVTGTSPFAAAGAVKTLQRICTYRQTPAHKLTPDAPRPLSDLIDNLLEKDPAHRPQSAAEVALAAKRLARNLGSGNSVTHVAVPRNISAAIEAETVDEPSTAVRLAERRQVTVMCCDLVSISNTTGSLDPEALYEVLPQFQSLADEVLERFGGHLESLLSHRLLVYFGFPQLRDDDAERAVGAALELIAAIEEYNAELASGADSIELAVRIGIHTGKAVVLPSLREQLALGKTLDLATGLVALAAPNTVMISDATHHLTESSFSYEVQKGSRIQGIAEPVDTYRVMDRRS
ncbi:MAG: protein kinase [Thermoanaerobaculia bacterium]